ncbi:MAG: hypothetical protein WCB53_16720 [Terriglobales bacterium]
MYLASGFNAGYVAESFPLSKSGTWTTLAPIPQATIDLGSAANNGVVYCIGGTSTFEG